MRSVAAIITGLEPQSPPRDALAARLGTLLARRHRRLDSLYWDVGSGSPVEFAANLHPETEPLLVWAGGTPPEWRSTVRRVGLEAHATARPLQVVDLVERQQPLLTGDILIGATDREVPLLRLGYLPAGPVIYGFAVASVAIWGSRTLDGPHLPKLRWLVPAADNTPNIVRYCYEAYGDRGMRRSEIGMALQAEGVPSPGGQITWSYSTLNRILTDPLYVGTNRWQGLLAPDTVPPLVAPALYHRVQARLWSESPVAHPQEATV